MRRVDPPLFDIRMKSTINTSSGTPTTVEVVGSRFTAGVYDPFLWLGERLGMQSRRRHLLSAARGRVLEIGAGTGLNVNHYPDATDELILTEPFAPMADLSLMLSCASSLPI